MKRKPSRRIICVIALLLAVSFSFRAQAKQTDQSVSPKAHWTKINGSVYWMQADGTILNKGGWQVLNGKRYYLAYNSGKRKTGWITLKSGKYYLDPKTGVLHTGVTKIGKSRYYLSQKGRVPGKMLKGFITENGKIYYTNKNGTLVAGWRTIKGKKYYFSEKGPAVSGWKTIKGKRYYFDPKECCLRNGWITSGDNMYYLNPKYGYLESTVRTLGWNSAWEFASYSAIHSDTVKLYKLQRDKGSKGIVVAVNAGHGTLGGNSAMTLSHPDGSPKVTGGSTPEGAVYTLANGDGLTFADGTPEGNANLSLAIILRDKLLSAGFDVLMIRETERNQLDNIARTVFANQYADCHISIHYDSSASDKGAFCIGVPAIPSYLAMYPVSTHYAKSNQLGGCLIAGMQSRGVKIFGSGNFPLDLTQTSDSRIPTIDVEVGDMASNRSPAAQSVIADGLTAGVKMFFGK